MWPILCAGTSATRHDSYQTGFNHIFSLNYKGKAYLRLMGDVKIHIAKNFKKKQTLPLLDVGVSTRVSDEGSFFDHSQ